MTVWVALSLVLCAHGEEAPIAGEAKPRFQLDLRERLDELPVEISGFWEMRGGSRLQQDRTISETASIAETRLQLEALYVPEAVDWVELRLKTDWLYDGVAENATLDVREASALLTPFEFADVKLGRQVLTWGTGDLLFINDLFPKNWKSFFIGRDDEYLKDPSDAVKVSFFHDVGNLNIVYTPRFRSDDYIEGERLSYWSDTLGRRAGQANRVRDDEPDDCIDDDEIALRLYRNIKGYEVAVYGYHGFWRTPAGFRPATGRATFPDLSVVGASVRGAVADGIGNVEIGYYDSRDDSSGSNPFVRNSELKALIGYEREIGRNFTAGTQYYIEWMMDHDRYLAGAKAAGIHPRDKVRHLCTLRLTKLLMNQNLRLSLFAFYLPSDSDAYLRPKAHYKIDDRWSAEVGANVFLGAHDYTFFGMFERNTNAYAAVRYSF